MTPGEEPLLHTGITDSLPGAHPWAERQVHCVHCGVLVHAFNNECMQAWIEWEDGATCLPCGAEYLSHCSTSTWPDHLFPLFDD